MLKPLPRPLLDSFRDLVPIITVIGFFPIVVLRQPLPDFGGLLVSDIARHVIARNRDPDRVDVHEIMASQC